MTAETAQPVLMSLSRPSARTGRKPIHMTESADQAWKRFAAEHGYADDGLPKFLAHCQPMMAGQLREPIRPPAVACGHPDYPAVFALIVEEDTRFVVIGFRQVRNQRTTEALFPPVAEPDGIEPEKVWPFLIAQRDAVKDVLEKLNPDSRIHADGMRLLALSVRLLHQYRRLAPPGQVERELPGYDPDAPPVLNERGLRAAVYKKVLQLVAEEIDLAAQSGKPGSEPWESPCRSELAGLKDRLSERLRSILHWSDPDVLRRPTTAQTG